jgi:hypothetical protein
MCCRSEGFKKVFNCEEGPGSEMLCEDICKNYVLFAAESAELRVEKGYFT